MYDETPKAERRNPVITILLGCGLILTMLMCVVLVVGGYVVFDLYREALNTPTATPFAIVEQDTPAVEALEPVTVDAQSPAQVTQSSNSDDAAPTETDTSTAIPQNTTPPEVTPIPSATVPINTLFVPREVNQTPIPPEAFDYLARLWSAEFPPHDYFEVSQRLDDEDIGERTVSGPVAQVGDQRTFFLAEGSVEATLIMITENVHVWMENDIEYNRATLERAIERLEEEFYPQMVELFGEEWRPGVDNDPHFSLMHLDSGTELAELGFFDSVNQYPQSIDVTSNEQEVVFLNMAELEIGSALYYGTMVHELQHLIQWNQDPNETVWLDEGLAQLAEIYLGFQTADSIDYLVDTHVQLNSWDYEGDSVYAHYAASYLFATYFWEQLGDEGVRALSADPANGLASVRNVLRQFRPDITLEQFLADWAVANYLDNASLQQRYGYQSFRLGQPDNEDVVRELPFEIINQVPQFGVHYVEIREAGTYSLTFAGDTLAPILPVEVIEDRQVWAVPPINELNATLTRRFDLTGINRATLEFDVWYELEEDFDYAYVSVSADNGQTWDLLVPDHLQPGLYGPAFNQNSADEDDSNNGWVSEAMSLNRYTGGEVLVRFEVLTDAAITGRGFAVENIRIPEIGYDSGPTLDRSQWQARGFIPVGANLPQQWSLQLIQNDTIITLPLNEFNQVVWPMEVDKSGAVLIVMPQTPFAEGDATYWLKVSE